MRPSLSPFGKNIYARGSNQVALLFIMHHLLIELSVTFARTMKHEIELQTCQSQIRTNLFFRILGEVVSQEHLDVPLIAHFSQDLPNENSLLLLQ